MELVFFLFFFVSFPLACLWWPKKHAGVKTGGSASVSGNFSLVVVRRNLQEFFHYFVALAVKASGRI